MTLEVVVQNHQEALQAEKLGAGRVELVAAISEGGLTPSYGTIKQVLQHVSIPVQIMVRPHSYHFYYDSDDASIILNDIQAVAELGGRGIVFGALNRDDTINEHLLQQVIETAPDMDITFHRAFDRVADQTSAYKVLAQYKDHIKRILTSGGEENCEAGKANLRDLVQRAAQINGPSIMPGAGLSPENIRSIHEYVRASEYHTEIGRAHV